MMSAGSLQTARQLECITQNDHNNIIFKENQSLKHAQNFSLFSQLISLTVLMS